MNPKVEFLPLGGGREIGANSFYYSINGVGILVDAGLHPEKVGWEGFPRLQALGDRPVDYFFVTHAHTDHLGAFPYVLQHYPKVRTYATAETIDIARIMLDNSAALIPKQHPAEVVDALTTYNGGILPELIASITPMSFGVPLHLADSGITVTFLSSGHILGAAGILFEVDGKRIFHTGDTSLRAQRLVGPAQLPKLPIDVLVSESTNGLADAYLSHSREAEYERLLTTISETLTEGGSVMIPVFALGKLQEVLSMVWDGMTEGRIPTVPIYTGGMGRKISDVYDKWLDSGSRIDHKQRISDIPQLELPKRDDLFAAPFFREPSIVLAASGMMQVGTPSYFLAQRWIRLHGFTIAFVGYTDPRTPGFVVSHAHELARNAVTEPEAVETSSGLVDGEEPKKHRSNVPKRLRFGMMKRDVPVRCRIERFRFSAHARRDELMEIVATLHPPKIILTHGDENAMEAFTQLILEQLPDANVSAPAIGQTYQLL